MVAYLCLLLFCGLTGTGWAVLVQGLLGSTVRCQLELQSPVDSVGWDVKSLLWLTGSAGYDLLPPAGGPTHSLSMWSGLLSKWWLGSKRQHPQSKSPKRHRLHATKPKKSQKVTSTISYKLSLRIGIYLPHFDRRNNMMERQGMESAHHTLVSCLHPGRSSLLNGV